MISSKILTFAISFIAFFDTIEAYSYRSLNFNYTNALALSLQLRGYQSNKSNLLDVINSIYDIYTYRSSGKAPAASSL